ncbi:MAG: ArsR family transcriptional regulator [Thermoplasmatales archaeon]|nr:ArsR family transcriptional regulator [Thermoplasmatales archaeon]
MRNKRLIKDKNIESAIRDILKSPSRARIYLFLLRNNGAKTDEIIKGTKLHPSTVRESLSKMNEQKLIYRKKLKNDSIGKNPYIYYPISPLDLLKKYTNEIEEKLTKIANLSNSGYNNNKPNRVSIKIVEKEDRL